MRLLLLLLTLFTFTVFAAEPAKVVSVIPVKFKSKGNHAPVPYSQQMMDRGWTSVPTISQPLTGGSPRYQPQRLAKPNLIRSLSSLAHRAANMSPAGKAALVAYGAYEANCTSDLFTSLCFDKAIDNPQTDFSDYIPAKNQLLTSCSATYGPKNLGSSSGATFEECFTKLKPSIDAAIVLPPASDFAQLTVTRSSSTTRDFQPYYVVTASKIQTGYLVHSTHTETYCPSPGECTTSAPTKNTVSYVATVSKGSTSSGFVCPPDSNPLYTNGPLLINSVQSCFKEAEKFKRLPVDEQWLDDQYNKNPRILGDSDITLDDFVDWETGQPRPDVFENPKYDPASKIFTDAAEAIARDVAQTTDPKAPHYIPPDLMPNLLIQINNWHEGNTFTDVFTGQQITPDSPPKEETPIDWSKFPGLTKGQYEASNNAWGNTATANKPDIQSEISELTDQQLKLTEFIEAPLPELPYEIDFPALFQLPTAGQCTGFIVTGTIAGKSIPISVDKHCPPYESWGRPVIDWFLGIMTIFQCFHIFRRTIEVA